MAEVRLETREINNWESFHAVCRATFGFPDFYGRNMNAWIDCLSSLRDGGGMSRFDLAAGEALHVTVADWADFRARLPEIAEALVESAAFVNRRYIDGGEAPALVIDPA